MNAKPLLTIAALFTGAVLTHASIIYNGNGATGFGGPVGNGSLTLSDDGTTISGTIANGNTSGGFNDSLVVYIDSVTGGFSTTSGFTDTLDTGRKAISAYDGSNRATINLGINADYALFLSPEQGQFGGVWQLQNGTFHTYKNSLGLSPTGADTFGGSQSSYTFSLLVADIGLTPNSGATFSFVATYLNGTNAFLSNETYGVTTGLGGSNPGSGGTTTLSGFNTYQIQPVPEPATFGALAGLGLGGISLATLIRRRKRSID